MFILRYGRVIERLFDKKHLATAKHQQSKELAFKRVKRGSENIAMSQRYIVDHNNELINSSSSAEAAVVADKDIEPLTQIFSGGNMPNWQTKHRMDVCEAFIRDAIPLETLRKPSGSLRQLLEHSRGSLPLTGVSQYIPMFLQKEIEKTKAAIGSRPISISFDGTTEVGELLTIVVRFVSKNHNICHRCHSFKVLSRSLDGLQLGAFLAEQLNNYWLNRQIHYISRDGASVNTAGIAHMGILLTFGKTADVICLSHTINVAGSRFSDECQIVEKIIQAWSSIVVHSGKVRREFLTRTGVSAKRKSEVRWFSWAEVGLQIKRYLSTIIDICRDVTNGCDALRVKVINIIDDEDDFATLQLELALLFDAMLPLISMCYAVEGDGFTAPFVFEMWKKLCLHLESCNNWRNRHSRAPNVAEKCIELVGDNDVIRQEMLFNHTMRKAHIVFQKLEMDNRGRIESQMRIFRACRLFNYSFIATTPLEALREEAVIYFPVILNLKRNLVDQLVQVDNLRDYKDVAQLYENIHPLDAVTGGPEKADCMWSFWREHILILPAWFQAAEEIALIMPSSACVERIFSLYDAMFGDNQQGALEDLRECSVMTRFNENQRAKFRHEDD